MQTPLYHIEHGPCPLVLVSVHEGRYIPESLQDDKSRPLGIADPADLDRHIAFDLGSREVTSFLAADSGAHVFRLTHSRLVADLNRFDDELECVAPVADGTDIPLNQALDKEARATRLQRFYFPVLAAWQNFIAGLAQTLGREPFVVSMHTFARTQRQHPEPKHQDVCVFGYPEFGPSPNLDRFVERLRRENPTLAVGVNEPFSARTPGLKTAPHDHRMACPVTYFGVVRRRNVFNHFVVEICQDLLVTTEDQRRFAKRISSALMPLNV